ncbi:long-chain fatty acid transport protein 4 isoform X4 [Folsomia candida]|uniref:long-chain fatty acid transport protein 4 isoform X4 n=1 Tax=Folsomia candida TaxID=158441 RepID=UPI0016055A38|nr:long-chain fatty acid transport protein 4 isoform X4 [Folsomia candida]
MFSSSTGSFLDNGCQPADAVVTNGAMFKSPIVQNGSDAYPSSDLRKSSSLAGKIAAANGYTLGSDAILRNGHHRNSPTESIKNLNSKNSTLTTTNGLIFKDKSLKKERPSEEVVHQNGGHTLKPVNDQGMLTAKMQTLKSPPPSSDAYNSNANGKSNSHHYTESDSISSATKDSHKHVDFTSSVTKYVILGVILALGFASGSNFQDLTLTIIAQFSTLGILLWAIYRHRRWCLAALKTIPRDIVGAYRYGRILLHVTYCQRKNWTFLHMFAENVKRHPNKVCFYFEDEVWSFRDIDEESNRIANYFASQGLQKGECVSVFMENRPMYVCIWLGLSKIGVIPALINFNLRQQPLKHCFEVAKPKAIIFGHELGLAINEVIELGPLPKCDLYSTGHGDEQLLFNSLDLDVKIKSYSKEAPVISTPINFSDKLLYIFTSGTTGLPKAAIIKHSRFIFFTMGIHYFVGISNDEVIYDPLPLYHTAGGMIGVGQALIHGCTAVLRRKFSASSYFKDCARYNCTAAQYIGEICRYLLCQPPNSSDKNHQVRLMFGNGLRPQIWEKFASRFNISIISEFYGATEGNCNIINIDNHVGSVGFISIILPFIYPVTLIRVDEATGEVMRDPRTGLVLRCKPNEPGELVGKIVPNHPVREFDGYADSNATTKKIVTDVFRKGDAAFRTGDVLIMDECGYFYFKDRTGDTFRWKGENCSTAEVEAVVSNVCGLKDAVCYGVEIPFTDGRAGMAAILDPDASLDFDSLAHGVTKSLPSYARPLFVRIVKHLDMTGTYKMKKIDLQKEGFDVTKISDGIFFLCNGKYVRMDNELYSKIISGYLRL